MNVCFFPRLKVSAHVPSARTFPVRARSHRRAHALLPWLRMALKHTTQCFGGFPQEFILNQDWNDPKSQLQQCCLTLRTEGKEPDIPLYK